MIWRAPRLGLPLLAKELVEMSGRRRTYAVRLVYATLLFLVAYWQFAQILDQSGPTTFGALGSGKAMFEYVVLIQFLGILLFLPAISCGAITSEKEHDSLTMLLVTKLGPGTILFEKLLSRLIPMFSFLLLSMPLLAFVYSLGGVETFELISGIGVLAMTCVYVGSLAVMCSSFSSSTVSAFIGTYTLGLMSWLLLLIFNAMGVLIHLVNFHVWLVHKCTGVNLLMSVPVTDMDQVYNPLTLTTSVSLVLQVQLVFLLIPSLVFFLLGRYFLVKRAEVARKNIVLQFFRGLDRFFTWLNNITTGGVVLVRDDVTLPDDEPIAWRETRKKSLGTTRYLVRVLVSIETPLFMVLAAVAATARTASLGVAAESLYAVWAIAVLLITVQATSLVSSERTHQTLDVLLSTTIDSREILRQKFYGIRRMMLVLGIPFMTIFLFEAWFSRGAEGLSESGTSLLVIPRATLVAAFQHFDYILCAVLSVLVYLPLVAWIAFLIGVKCRSQARALLITLLVVFGWAFLPVLLAGEDAGPITRKLLASPPAAMLALAVSPSVIIVMNETRDLVSRSMSDSHVAVILMCTLVNFAIYGLAWLGLRSWCMANAGRLLGRLESRDGVGRPPEPTPPVRALPEASPTS